MDIGERFRNKWSLIPDTGCHLWTSVSIGGYGVIRQKGKWAKAHRLSYELYKGKIPKGKCVCHTCDNPLCVNPDHLFLGTHKDNMQDKVRKGRAFTGNQKGSANGAAKLTEAVVRSIRGEDGTCKALAIKFCTSPMNISLIKRRLAWAHVE